MRIHLSLAMAIVLSVSIVSLDQSIADIRQGDQVLIAEDEVIDDDVYIFAQTVIVNGTIKGDLIVAGQNININGSVDGDLIAAGQQISVNGKVSDDVRIAGQMLTLQDGADIHDDLIAAGYSIECAKASHVGGELKYAGYQSVLAGRVDKNVDLASAKCQLSGSFGADVNAAVDGGDYENTGFFGPEYPAAPPGLTVAASAKIVGDLNYQSKSQATIDPASTIGGKVNYSQIESTITQPPTIAERAGNVAKTFFALLLVGLMVVYICPKWTGQVANSLQRRPLASLAWGVMTSIAFVVAAVLLIVATIAIAVLLGFISLDNLIFVWVVLGLLTTTIVITGFWIYSAWIAKVIVIVWAGNRIINGPDWVSKNRILALSLGTFAFVVLTWIPYVGSIIALAVVMLGIGSTAISFFTKPQTLVPGKPGT